MQILTHRGLDPLNKKFCFLESSKEAFLDQLGRGYGLEFDVNFSKDDFCFIFHDGNLSRITNGKDRRKFIELTKNEILDYKINGNSFIGFEELLENINKFRKVGEYSALHLKAKFQEKKYLDLVLGILEKFPGIENKIFIFDVKIEAAKYTKGKNKDIKLFASVAHKYDIERFNNCTGGTLLSIEKILKNKDLFDGVWLDEWDRKDTNQGVKKFYTKENFELLQEAGFLIGLVSPELHNSSPGLLGGEVHEDVGNIERILEIENLKPDFICSDYISCYD